MDNPQSNVQTEITRHLCQAHAVQIKSLQNSLTEIINQTNKALEDGQPELAQSLWKQVVHATQNIGRLFNQTNAIMYSQQTGSQFGTQQGRFNGYSNGGNYGSRNRGRQGRQQRSSFPTRQLNKIARQVDELVSSR